MGVDEFKRLALGFPEAAESSHMGHPDFRVRGKVFATLGYPADGWGMVKLTPGQQELYVQVRPAAFQPVKGGWGIRGATSVHLRRAPAGLLREALAAAWRNVAPAALVLHPPVASPGAPRPRTRRRAERRPGRRTA